jgi:hypothetical protein
MGFDLDAASLILAEANLRLVPGELARCRTEIADASLVDVGEAAAWHCDPDRRVTGRRATAIELFSPAHEALDRLRAKRPDAAIKLAPATQAPMTWAAEAELEWLGSRGECRQQVAWFGALARHPGQRAATIVEADAIRTIVGGPSEDLPIAEACGEYVYEPHAVVLAAKLTNVVCQEHDLAALSPVAAYLTADELVADGALAAFAVREVFSFDRKRLKAYCREHRLGRLEVKKRGVDVDPNRLARELACRGDEAATILLAPIQGKVMAIVADRVSTPASGVPLS